MSTVRTIFQRPNSAMSRRLKAGVEPPESRHSSREILHNRYGLERPMICGKESGKGTYFQ